MFSVCLALAVTIGDPPPKYEYVHRVVLEHYVVHQPEDVIKLADNEEFPFIERQGCYYRLDILTGTQNPRVRRVKTRCVLLRNRTYKLRPEDQFIVP